MKFVQNNLVLFFFQCLDSFFLLIRSFMVYPTVAKKPKPRSMRSERRLKTSITKSFRHVSLEHDLKLAIADLDKLASDEQLKPFVEDSSCPGNEHCHQLETQIRGSHQLDPHPSVRPTYQIVQRQKRRFPESGPGFRFSFRRTTCGGDE